MNRRSRVDSVILAMQAVGPVRVDAVVAAFHTEPQLRRGAIGQAGRDLEVELLLPVRLIGARSRFSMLALPLGLERQIGRPDEAVAGEILLQDRLELELIFRSLFAR